MSPLTTYRLANLIEYEERKRTERLARVDQRAGELETAEKPDERRRIQAGMQATRRAAGQLFDQRNEMEQTAYEVREGRIASFNDRYRTAEDPSPWDGRFLAIDDLPPEKRSEAWKDVSGVFRRLQECFAYPDEYVLPRRSDEQPDILTQALILNPECVPDDLAQKLGIVSFDEDDTPVERWHKKHAPASAEALYAKLANAQPLRRGNMRLLLLPDGRILYSSENVSATADPTRRPALKAGVYDVYGAYRKTFHERELYGQETATLERVKARLGELGGMIATWTPMMPDAEKQQIEGQAIPVIDECAEELEACIDVYKRVAGDTLDGIEDFTVTRRRDGRRIKNPSAVMAKLVKTRDALERRFGEMVPKGRYNQEDSMVLQREIERSEQVFTGLRGKLTGANVATVQGLAKDHHFNGLKGIRVEPLKTYAEKILAIKKAELDPKKEGSPDDCIDPMVKIYVITKFQEVARCFEQMKIRMLSLEHLHVYEYRQLVDELAALFTSIDIFPDHRIDAYVAPYEQMCGELQTIQRGLVRYDGQTLPIDQRKELFERFRSYLDRFDIRQIIAELP